MRHLFICAIGPVQDFIATARRSRDLWYGSWMLSELSKAAARALAERYGRGSLVFPAPSTQAALLSASDLNVSNRIVAEVTDAPATVGRAVEEAVRKRLGELSDEALSRVRGEFDRDLAERQLADLVEYYWVGVEMAGTADYRKARELAEALLAARKATRDFPQFAGSSNPKSSLDGARESVIPEEGYPSGRDNPQQRARKVAHLYRAYGARRGERLSGIDLVKRLGMRGREQEPRFRSTSHMAAQPFLTMVNRVKGDGTGNRLISDIRSLLAAYDINAEDHDGSLLYESRLREWIAEGPELDDLRQKLEDCLSQYAGKARSGTYYALLLADGDSMGACIDAQPDAQSHRQLSEGLADFAVDVPQIVQNKHGGVLIYAGGDDILAYLPLHTVLQCAAELSTDFSKRMKAFTTAPGKSPTLSAGLVVVHHLDPLSEAFELARDAEKTAKSVPGKNALAITISRRSGVPRTISGHWSPLTERLTSMISFVRQEAIAKGVAYELQDLQRALGSDAEDLQEGLLLEAIRIVKRKRKSGTSKPVSDEVIEAFEKWLGSRDKSRGERVVDQERRVPTGEQAGEQQDGRVPVGNLAQELIVAALFADAADLAYGPLRQVKEASSS